MRPVPVTGWSVDTRTQNAGDLYFALRGPNHDGHDYVAAAIAKGRGGRGGGIRVGIGAGGRGRQLVVADTLQALQDLGAWARRAMGRQGGRRDGQRRKDHHEGRHRGLAAS